MNNSTAQSNWSDLVSPFLCLLSTTASYPSTPKSHLDFDRNEDAHGCKVVDSFHLMCWSFPIKAPYSSIKILTRLLNSWFMASRLSCAFRVCLIYGEKTSSGEMWPITLNCHIHWAHWWWRRRGLLQNSGVSPILPGVDCNELSVVAADLWCLKSCSRLSRMRAPLMALFSPCGDLEKLSKLPRGPRPGERIPDLWLEWIFNLIGFLLPWASVLPWNCIHISWTPHPIGSFDLQSLFFSWAFVCLPTHQPPSPSK